MSRYQFNIIRVNDATKARVRMNAAPLSHQEACVMLSKQVKWDNPSLRTFIEPSRDGE